VVWRGPYDSALKIQQTLPSTAGT